MSRKNTSNWDAAVKRLQTRVNLIALLDKASMPVFCVGAVAAFLVYFMRRQEVDPLYSGLIVGGLIAACLIWGWFQIRAGLFREKDSRAFLDEQLGLYGALSASVERNVELPQFPAKLGGAYKWDSYKSFYWIAGGVALLLLGVLLPLSTDAETKPVIDSVPPALAQVEDWINQLEQQDDIEQETVEPLREQLDEFMKKSREEMYSHSGLEAADALKSHTENSMLDFARDLDALSNALGEMQSELNKGNEADTKDLSDALNALENAALQPGGQLAQSLTSIDPSSIKQLTPEQMKQLMDQLKNASDCVNQMCENGSSVMDPDESPYKLVEGEGPGRGGVDRGRGDAPLVFNENGTESIKGTSEKLDSDNMSNASLGEQVGIQRGAHDVDPEQAHRVESSGSASQPALGGDAVWTDNVSPREREALRKVFN